MKMMHLMVNRRQVQHGKKSSLVVNESTSLCDDLTTFAEDRQESEQSLEHPPARWSYTLTEPDHLSFLRKHGDEAVRRQDGENAAANGDGEEGMSTRRQLRAASMDTKQQLDLGPKLTTSTPAFRENLLRLVVDGVPEAKLPVVDDSVGKFAYISLDGRLINAELATSATSIGGGLSDEEAKAWQHFAPMQRVLIVAVSAAAAAAAKHRNREEIDLLRKTVKTRENELILLRQQLNELCKQNHRNVSHIHPESRDNPAASSCSPQTPEMGVNGQQRSSSFDGANSKVKLDSNEAWSSSKPAAPHGGRRTSRDSPENKDVVLAESGSADVSPCKGGSQHHISSMPFPLGNEAWAKEEAKWYVNPMVETLHDFYNISTPERANSMFSVCNPAVQGSFEWTVMRSSFATQDTDPHLPLIAQSPPRNTPLQANWGNCQPKPEVDGILNKEHKAMRAVCAAVVLDLRERMLTVLDKESSLVMAALDKSVEDAKAQIASMHLGVASCWNASVPKALAALSLSPSDFDNYLNETQGAASTWNDISKIEESIVSWRQYLEANYSAKAPFERKSPTSNGSLVERNVSDERLLTCSSCPHCSSLDDDVRLESQGGGLAYPKNSAAELIEQLIRELDKAAAKVAVMEHQMKKLEQDVAGCDSKQSIKLPKCSKQKLEDQVKGCDDVSELVRQIQLKKEEVAYLQKGQQALMNNKTEEIEELKKDQERHSVELDKQLVAATTTKVATANRLLMLDELCTQKDCTLSILKQDVQPLELKVHGSRVYQSPTIPPIQQNFTSSNPSSSNKYEALQKQRLLYAPSPPGSDHIFEHTRLFKRDTPSYKGHHKNLHHINIQKQKELTNDGRLKQGCNQETSQEYLSPPGSTIEDDCSINSLKLSKAKVESHLESKYCSSSDDSIYHNSLDRLFGANSSWYNRSLQNQKFTSSSNSIDKHDQL